MGLVATCWKVDVVVEAEVVEEVMVSVREVVSPVFCVSPTTVKGSAK